MVKPDGEHSTATKSSEAVKCGTQELLYCPTCPGLATTTYYRDEAITTALRVISEIHDEQTRELLLRAGLTSGSHSVEFGCGLGYVTRWAAAMGAHALGIDVNGEQVKASQELAKNA